MKIIEVAFTLSPGGAERFVVDLSNELANLNDVTLLTIKDDTVEPELRNFYKFDLSENVHYECLGLRSKELLKTWVKTYLFIKNQKPDIVHFHGDTMPLHILPALFLLSKKIRFVQTVHSDVNYGYNNRLYRILTSTIGKHNRLKFVALSETNYNDFMRMYPGVSIVCIVNGRAPMVKTKLFEQTQREVDSYKINANTKVFIHVARCNEVKNQKRLVSSFDAFVKNGANAVLLIIGEGFKSKLGDEIKALADGNIHFLGPKKNISDYQFCADAFCLSSDSEGMPISILEALLAGTPVVSTPVCGAVDAIVDGQNGCLAKDFSNESYTEALCRIYGDMDHYKQSTMSLVATSPFTIKKCAENYLKVFSKN